MDIEMIFFLIVVCVILIAITIFGLLTYSGIFTIPKVHTGEPPIKHGCTFAYKFLRGPYSSNDVGATFTEVTSIAPRARSIGIFYDDPQAVSESRLRCAVGCIISEDEAIATSSDSDTAAGPSSTEDILPRSYVNEREEQLLKTKEFKFCRLPRVDLAVTSEFPYTTPFSIWLAPNKVYPRLCDFISSRSLCAYPMIEVYEDDRIKYMAPLSKQEEFFVPETKNVEPEPSTHDDADNETEEKPASLAKPIDKPKLSNEKKAADEESTIRRRRAEKEEAGSSPKVENLETKIEKDGSPKRKDSSQSSASSSFEQVGVEDL